MKNNHYDIIIIGGGINGCGIACDAAGRGLKVLLCEQNDLASGTSSKSSQLIHGGLRYLETFQFRLVREALREREILLNKAPHIIKPLRFILPHAPHLRPAWMIRAGLFLYDHLSWRNHLPASKKLNLKSSPLNERFQKAFSYSDCWVDDARLVILNAIAAREHGADIRTRHPVTKANRLSDKWEVIADHAGQKQSYTSTLLINASGPWAARVNQLFEKPAAFHLNFVKGSHIIVPKLYPEHEAYILQHSDARIVFVIPYKKSFSLIGTTEEIFSDDPGSASISQNETRYLCELVNDYFKKQITEEDIVHAYSGVRPLYSENEHDFSAMSRDYHMELDRGYQTAPLLTILGGKITSYRKLAEQALSTIQDFFPDMKGHWTERHPLPGGDIGDPKILINELLQVHPSLPPSLIERYCHTYGSRSNIILNGVQSLNDLGKEVAPALFEKEIDYLINEEWADTADDILWRRTKLGLQFSEDQRKSVSHYLSQRAANIASGQ